MSAFDLIVLSNGKQKRRPSQSNTFDFLSVKIGPSGLEIKETSGAFDFGSKVLSNIADGIATTDAATKGQLDTGLGAKLALAGGTMSGAIAMGGNKVTGLADGSASGDAATYNQLTTGLGTKIDSSLIGAANGVAPLGADNLLPSQYLPALAIVDTNVVNSQAAMLALTAEKGDVAIRTDINKSFILRLADATQLASWQEILTPASPVVSVNGKIGNLTLYTDDIAEAASSPTNLWFTAARAKAAAVANAINSGTTDVAPSQDAVYQALALKANITDVEGDLTATNSEASAVTVNQIVYEDAFGSMKLALATNANFGPGTVFGLVKDASVASGASGKAVIKKGRVIGGFSGLTVNQPVYISRATAGAVVQGMGSFQAGDQIVKVGKATSATEVSLDFQFVMEY